MDIIQDALALMMSGSGSSPVLDTVKFTVNGTFTPSVGVDGWNEVEVEVLPTLETLNVTSNGTYTPPAGTDGYSAVTVAVNKDFYPKAHATLDDVSRVEGDNMRVYPINGTDYYPYIYLSAKPYGSQEEYEPVGKYFEGRTEEHVVSPFLDLINVETGESASGYPQQVASTSANYSIVSGGWIRIKAWSLNATGSTVSITIERYNPTYTKPVETTHGSATVQPTGALQSYLNTSYYITTVLNG